MKGSELNAQISLPMFRETPDAVDVGELVSLLRKRASLIIGFTLAGGLLAALMVLFATPQFTAHGALYLGDAQTASGGSSQSDLGFTQNFSVQSDVQTQIELITSKALVQQALMETGLNAQVAPVGVRPLNYWQWRLRDGGQISAYLPTGRTLQVLYADVPGSYKLVIGKNNSYKLLALDGVHSTVADPVLSGALGQAASGHGVHMLVRAAAPPLQAKPGDVYDVRVRSPGSLADFLLGSALTVTAGGTLDSPTKIAFLQFHWSNPYESEALLNQVMQDFISTQLAWKTESASTIQNFVAGQLVAVRQSLAQADENLATYQSQTGIMDVPQNAQSAITSLGQYQTQRSTLRLQVQALEMLAAELHRKGQRINPYLVSQANDPVLQNLTTNLSDAEVKMTALRVQYTATAQAVQVQAAQIRELEDGIRMVVDNDLATAKQSLASLDTLVGNYQSQIKTMPAESLKVIALQRSSDVLGQLYVQLMEKEQEAEVSKAATIIDTKVVTPAAAPDTATSPKGPVTVLFGAFAGLVMGLSIVFGKRASSGRYESESEIRKSITLPIIGTVPKRIRHDGETLLIGAEKNRSFAEAFRLMRGAIYRQNTGGGPVVVLVISALSGDGKTTIAANLAKAIGDDGRRVALVDGDLYRGSLQQRFTDGEPTKKGRGTKETPLDIYGAHTASFNVVPLTPEVVKSKTRGSGRELMPLSESALAERFARLRQEYEFIVIDSPPLPSVADGMTLGLFADIIISVITVSKTSRRSFAAHHELLALLGKPHGIVINLADWHEVYRNAA